jgi:putative transposase
MPEEVWADQRTPALAIVARGDQIEPKGPTEFIVRSQSRPSVRYKVASRRDSWECSCAFNRSTRRVCIHIFAVRYKNGFERTIAPPKERPVCEKCGSARVVINGCRRNQSGAVQRFKCKKCGLRFSGPKGFRKRRADPERIALALDLYFRGLSLRKVAEHLYQVYGLSVSAMTIYRWITHYSSLAAEWMDGQGAKVGDRWHVDETVVMVHGEPRYLWNVLDHDTRFLLSTHVSRGRSILNTRRPFQKAKQATKKRPKQIFSDGMLAYPHAIRREFGITGRPSPHVRVKSIHEQESNNVIERFHGTEKERFKVMRGFESLSGTSALAEGLRVHYNLVRTHQSLEATPGSLAGLPELGRFKWRDLLVKSATMRSTAPATIELIAEGAGQTRFEPRTRSDGRSLHP